MVRVPVLLDDSGIAAEASLAGEVAHRFNNTLAVIIANLEMAAEDLAAGHPLPTDQISVALLSARAAASTCRVLADFARPPGVKPYSVRLASVLDSLQTVHPDLDIRFSHPGLYIMAEESELLAALGALTADAAPIAFRTLSVSTGSKTASIRLDGVFPRERFRDARELLSPVPDRNGRLPGVGQVRAMVRRAGGTLGIGTPEAGHVRLRLRFALASSDEARED